MSEAINNFDKIRRLLKFDSEDDFYFVHILQRKKDHGNKKVNGANNNSRLIKSYYIKSLEHFDFVKPEIIQMCDIFGARAGINLNRRSFEKMALQHLRKVTDQILNKDYKQAPNAYNSVCGSYSNETDKRWILDIDDVGRDKNELILFAENECKPDGRKFVSVIPSKSGYHLIMNPFDIQKFSKAFPDIEIHKNNPTNLYIPK